MGKRQDKLQALSLEIEEILKDSKVIEIEIKEHEPSKIHLVDEDVLAKLLLLQGKHNYSINENEDLEKKQVANLKRYGFERACKIFNPYSPCYSYSLQIEKKWKQVNDPIKVKERLDEEYEVWANAYKKHAFEELDKSQAEAEFIASEKKEVLKEISEAKQQLLFIKENFDTLEDVRISSRDRARKYATIHFKTEDSTKQKKLHVNISKFNVLWYVKREDRSLETFMKNATHAFGDVYYLSDSL